MTPNRAMCRDVPRKESLDAAVSKTGVLSSGCTEVVLNRRTGFIGCALSSPRQNKPNLLTLVTLLVLCVIAC